MTSALATRDYYLNENSTHELDAYHKYMTNLAILLGANASSAGDELMKVLEFEKQLANVSKSILHIPLLICINNIIIFIMI